MSGPNWNDYSAATLRESFSKPPAKAIGFLNCFVPWDMKSSWPTLDDCDLFRIALPKRIEMTLVSWLELGDSMSTFSGPYISAVKDVLAHWCCSARGDNSYAFGQSSSIWFARRQKYLVVESHHARHVGSIERLERTCRLSSA